MRSRPVAVLLIICVVVCSAAAQEQSLINFLTADEGAEFRKLEIAVRRSFANRGFQKGLDALRGQMEILETAGKREGAGRAFLDEASKVNWYNQACCLSRLGEKAEAVKTLARAVDLGFTSVEKIRADPDLDGIRNEVSFKALLAGILFNDAFAVFVPKALAVVGAKPAPLLLVLHEGEGNEKDCLARYRDLATRRGAILTAPRAPIFRSKGRYVWRNMTAVGTEKAALRKVREVIEAVREKHAVDPKRILLLGEGEGGTIAALLVCRRPAEFAGVLLVSARWPRYLVADDLLKAKEAETQKGRVAFVAKKDGRYAKGAERAGKQLAGAGFSAKVFLREKGSVAKALAWLME